MTVPLYSYTTSSGSCKSYLYSSNSTALNHSFRIIATCTQWDGEEDEKWSHGTFIEILHGEDFSLIELVNE